MFRFFITKNDFDMHFTDEHRASLAIMFLPLLTGLVNLFPMISNQDVKEDSRKVPDLQQRMFLIQFIWLLFNLPGDRRARWWASLNATQLTHFLGLLELAAQKFKYVGIKQRRDDTVYESTLAPEVDGLFSEGGTENQKSSLEQLADALSNRGARRGRASTLNHQGSTRGSITGGSTFRALRARIRSGTLTRTSGSQQSTGGSRGGGTLTSNNDELLQKLIRWECGLNVTVSQTILSVVTDFVEAHLQVIRTPEGIPILAKILDVTIAILGSNQTNDVLHAWFAFLALFFKKCERLLFEPVPIKIKLKELAGLIFKHCTYKSVDVKKYALTVVYVLITLNFKYLGNLVYMQDALTVSMSKLVADLRTKQNAQYADEEKCLFQVLEALPRLHSENTAQTEKQRRRRSIEVRKHKMQTLKKIQQFQAEEKKRAAQPKGFLQRLRRFGGKVRSSAERAQEKEAIQELKQAYEGRSVSTEEKLRIELQVMLGKLNIILADSLEIERQMRQPAEKNNPRLTESLMFMVADAFGHITRIKLDWLRRLAEHHTKYLNYAEAGQTYLDMAQLARSEYKKESSSEAEVKKMLEYYEKACQRLQQAHLYERAHEVFNTLNPIYEERFDYEAIGRCYNTLHDVFTNLIAAEKTQSRMLGTYYRVGFYGTRFTERLDGKEYVYKMPMITQLSEIVNELKSLYSKICVLETDDEKVKQNGYPIRILPDSGQVDRSALNPNDCVIQITKLELYKPNAERYIEKNSDLDCFYFSTPFTKSGTGVAGTADLCTRLTRLYVVNKFPSLRTVQVVSRREEIVRSPIETATVNLQGQVVRVNSILREEKKDKRVLSQVLLGSVATSVNGGLREVCDVFLGDSDLETKTSDEFQYEAKHFAALKMALADCLKAFGKALDAHGTLVESNADRELQTTCASSFESLSSYVTQRIVITPEEEAALRVL
jgi:hypothetical protein